MKKPKDLTAEQLQKRRRRIERIYITLALVILPLYTMRIGTHYNVFEMSISEMSYTFGSALDLQLWSIVFGGFFASFAHMLLIVSGNKSFWVRFSAWGSASALFLANLFPFLPYDYPTLTTIHNNLAFASSVMLGITLIMYTQGLKYTYPKIHSKNTVYLIILACAAVLMLNHFGTMAVTEIMCVLMCCGFFFLNVRWFKAELQNSQNSHFSVLDTVKNDDDKITDIP